MTTLTIAHTAEVMKHLSYGNSFVKNGKNEEVSAHIDVTIPTIMNVAVATKERGRSAAMPQIP